MKVVLGAFVLFCPLVAWPCSASFPDDWSSPANGATAVPRNLAAFLVGGCAFEDRGNDGGLRLTRSSSDAGVTITEQVVMERPMVWTRVKTAETFAEGESVRLDHSRGCGGLRHDGLRAGPGRTRRGADGVVPRHRPHARRVSALSPPV